MRRGSEFMTEVRARTRELKHDHLSSCTYRVEVLGDGVSTGAKRSRRVQMDTTGNKRIWLS